MLWVGFNLFVLAMLAVDLFVFHRQSHEVRIKEALVWTGVWITLALLFNAGVYYWFGSQKALEFLTGYLIEKSLSVDNIFVFMLIFSYFKVPAMYQHKVLFWGILGALVMRAIFIAAGVSMIQRFHWMIYLFGAFLVITGFRIAVEKDKEIHPERNPLLRLFRRIVPMTENYEDGKFVVRRRDGYFATPLLAVLTVVETTDVIFAVDSIPAIMAVTLDSFIIYSSNVFAILGLRALYFALAGTMQLFQYLHYGLAAILIFVGAKMLLSEAFTIHPALALGIVAGILTVAVAASIIRPR
jgi:tellurite resistance protein TerC